MRNGLLLEWILGLHQSGGGVATRGIWGGNQYSPSEPILGLDGNISC